MVSTDALVMAGEDGVDEDHFTITFTVRAEGSDVYIPHPFVWYNDPPFMNYSKFRLFWGWGNDNHRGKCRIYIICEQ